MARRHRENVEGGIYHIYARGNAGDPIYRDAADRRIYLRKLETVVGRWRWRCLSYCLMTNHLHLMIETPAANLSSGMQYLQGRYAQWFNIRHDRSGHVFQGRYGAVRILSDSQLCSAAAYIARNPVEAGLCSHPAEWSWSSFRAVVDGDGPAWLDGERLLAFFGDQPAAAARVYATMSATYHLKGSDPV